MGTQPHLILYILSMALYTLYTVYGYLPSIVAELHYCDRDHAVLEA